MLILNAIMKKGGEQLGKDNTKQVHIFFVESKYHATSIVKLRLKNL